MGDLLGDFDLTGDGSTGATNSLLPLVGSSYKSSTDLDGFLGGPDDDSLFDTPSRPSPQVSAFQAPESPAFDAPLDTQGSSPFDAPEQPRASASVPAFEKPSALIAWRTQKQAELEEKAAQDAEVEGALREKAAKQLKDYFALLATEQEKKAKRNQELDAEKVESLSREEGNPWVKVTGFIDFGRTDLHAKDVNAFKNLLIHLKR
jgi:hypothetical protein